MEANLVAHQLAFYTVLFFGTLGTVALWEYVAPRRILRAPLRVRWANNLAVFLVNTVAIWIVFPGFGIGAALVSTEEGWGTKTHRPPTHEPHIGYRNKNAGELQS